MISASISLALPENTSETLALRGHYAAAEKSDCDEMAEKYGWELVDVEETNDPILEVDCVFRGKTEFPKSYYDTEISPESATPLL